MAKSKTFVSSDGMRYEPVRTSDKRVLDRCLGVMARRAGRVTLELTDGSKVVFDAPKNAVLPVFARRILRTGTTAGRFLAIIKQEEAATVAAVSRP